MWVLRLFLEEPHISLPSYHSDSTSQYDAIRAYLKELDITDNVWIGLSKTTERPSFIWTNSLQPLSSEGHWQEAIPQSRNPLCVAMDPAKDFLWKPFTCGGPEVASFICETPIPSWARGPQGCLLTELPSLTVLYIPEQSSLELTSDCGLDGTKRIACKGNADREEILKQLTCAIPNDDFEDKVTKSAVTSPSVSYAQTESKTTKTDIWTLNTVEVDYGMPTRHRRETEDTLSASSTESTGKMSSTMETFTATNYDTEVTTSRSQDFSTIEPIVFNISSSEDLEIIQEAPKIITFTNNMLEISNISTENATPIIDIAETSTTVISTSSISTTTLEKDVAVEYPSAINQGQLFSIIENGTMFDIIELNETTEPKEKNLNVEGKQKMKPSTKLEQLDEKNTKLGGDSKNKAQSKKVMYKNAGPKQKHVQKNNEKLIENNFTITIIQKREEEEIQNTTAMEEIDLKLQLEIFSIKQIKEKDINQREDEQPTLKEDKETFLAKAENGTLVKIGEDINNKEDIDLNKEIEIFPVTNDKSSYLNRTFRKELPIFSHKPANEIDENKLGLMDVDGNTSDNSTEIDPNIDLLNKNFTENNDSEIMEHTHRELAIKPLKEETSTIQYQTSTEKPIQNLQDDNHPKPKRQRQLTKSQGTMFDIIELNETTEPKEENFNAEGKPKMKPSTKLAQLDEKNTKLGGDHKNKAQSKKDIYKNADPKKKNVQKNNEKLIENNLTITIKQKREEIEPQNTTKDMEEKEQTDLKSQVEMFPIKQIEEKDIDQREDEQTTLNEGIETFPVTVDNKTLVKIDEDIDKKEDIDLNKEVEIFPIINDKSSFLNRTFRKELPILSDNPAKEIDENKLELMDVDEKIPDNSTKIDPNIDLLNKNITKNIDSEIIGHIDKEVLKRQLLPKPLQEQTSTTHKQTSTEETIKNDDHPKPNRQRQLTRPHGRPFYPNFFSRVLG